MDGKCHTLNVSVWHSLRRTGTKFCFSFLNCSAFIRVHFCVNVVAGFVAASRVRRTMDSCSTKRERSAFIAHWSWKWKLATVEVTNSNDILISNSEFGIRLAVLPSYSNVTPIHCRFALAGGGGNSCRTGSNTSHCSVDQLIRAGPWAFEHPFRFFAQAQYTGLRRNIYLSVVYP